MLTGGASRRMGRDKALIEVGGRPMAVGVASVLRAAGAREVFAVGGDVASLGRLGLAAIPDDHPGEGPLGGLLTALAHACHPLVAVLACDLPAPRSQAVHEVVVSLAVDPGPVCAVPVVDGHLQPLHAAWRRSARPELQAAFDGGERALHRVIASVVSIEVRGIAAAALVDADTPDQLPVAPPPTSCEGRLDR